MNEDISSARATWTPTDIFSGKIVPMSDVAIVSYQPIPRLETASDMTQYVFVIQHNVSLAWIPSEHVDQILSRTKHCCGNSRKPLYRLATEDDIRIWNYGGR